MKTLFSILLIGLFAFSLSAQSVNNLRLKTVDNKRFEIKEYLDKGPVVIAFWATWCKPCRKELPAIKEVYEKYKDQGLTILAISIDSPRSLSKVKSFVKSSDLPYEFLIDPNGEQSTKLQVKDIPYTLLANKSGEIVYTHRGYREGDEKELDEKISELLNESEKN